MSRADPYKGEERLTRIWCVNLMAVKRVLSREKNISPIITNG